MSTNEAIALTIVCVFMVAVIPIVGGLMYARRERLLTHAERMRALELHTELPDHAALSRTKAATGQSVADEASQGSLARKCYSTAVWVAFWGFAAAAGLGGAEASAGVAYAIASAAGAIGVTAVICGTVLASRVPSAEHLNGYAKRTVEDADAFDVVSCRG
jgi:hypothetical protein